MTTVTTTANPATGSILVNITNAPIPGAPNYTNVNKTGVDGWAVKGGTTLFGGSPGTINVSVPTGAAAGVGMTRTVTGLVVGNLYRLTASFLVSSAAPIPKIGVVGKGHTAVTMRNVVQGVTYAFNATATSHVLEVITDASADPSAMEDFSVSNITLQPASSSPLDIRRSDANGTDIPVRLPANFTPASNFSFRDYEAALSGTIVYRVIPGVGDPVIKTVNLHTATKAHLTSVLRPDAYRHEVSGGVTAFSADMAASHTVHDVIEREDALVTLGPVHQRRGTLVFRERTRAKAEEIESIYRSGSVSLLRFPRSTKIGTSAVRDLYHVAMRIGSTVEADVLNRNEQHWLVTVEYIEVARPEGGTLA